MILTATKIPLQSRYGQGKFSLGHQQHLRWSFLWHSLNLLTKVLKNSMIDVVAVLEVTLVKVFTEHRSMAGNDIYLNHSVIIKLGELLVQLAANISNFFISILRNGTQSQALVNVRSCCNHSTNNYDKFLVCLFFIVVFRWRRGKL